MLKRLARTAKFASITASNAIEDVIVDDGRALELIQAPEASSYANRSEEEFAGYRDAADYLLGKEPEPLTLPLVLHVHRLLLQHTGDPSAGKFKESDNLIGRENPDGTIAKVFRPVPAGEQTVWHLTELIGRYEQAVAAALTPAPILVGLLVLDFLAIHPFQDGNGRVARLLTSNELQRHGYGVSRYASLEQRIFESKNSYYRSLRESQRDWHDGTHDPWPWTEYLLTILAGAYDDFEQRVVAGRVLQGKTKIEQVRAYILEQAPSEFRFVDVQAALPDIGAATIRNGLQALSKEGLVSTRRGRNATWTRTEPDPLGGRTAGGDMASRLLVDRASEPR